MEKFFTTSLSISTLKCHSSFVFNPDHSIPFLVIMFPIKRHPGTSTALN